MPTPDALQRDPHDASPMKAAYAYVDAMVPRADVQMPDGPAWYGWAIRQAFLDGVDWARTHKDE